MNKHKIMNIKDYLKRQKIIVEQALEKYMLSGENELADHIESMRYSLFAGGKRIRPVLAMAAAEACGVSDGFPMQAACALECIHTYSLIHDDLPAMDNDDLRRGKPTNHKMFGEAEAILAGDGLLTYAFELLSSPLKLINTTDQLTIINIISKASGSIGMVGGQSLDIDSEGKDISFKLLQSIHSHKTGALITASIQTGAIIGKAAPEEFKALTTYGNNIGLAFQIVDDLLNVTGTTEELGKAAGSDADLDKATYPSFFGLEKTRELAAQTVETAISALENFNNKAEPLRELAKYVLNRRK
jgi:geranylgeranyl diphosphate synthase, type II